MYSERMTYDEKNLKLLSAYEERSCSISSVELTADQRICTEAQQALDRRDHRNARRLFLGAAELGNVEAMVTFADMCVIGMGGKKDLEAALLWFQRAFTHKEGQTSFVSGHLSELEGHALNNDLAHTAGKSPFLTAAEINFLLGESHSIDDKNSVSASETGLNEPRRGNSSTSVAKKSVRRPTLAEAAL